MQLFENDSAAVLYAEQFMRQTNFAHGDVSGD